jgi:hypothetical protein
VKLARTLTGSIVVIIVTMLLTGTAAARGLSLEVAQPLQDEILEKAPAVDMGFHPLNVDAARRSHFWNAFPQPLQTELFEKAPAVDMGTFPVGNVAKNPTEAVRQPPQCDNVCFRNPTEAVRQPPQCDNVCLRNPTEAVRQPPQCDNVCLRNPTEAVRQPPQCDGCFRNPTEAVKQPMQCNPCDPRNPTEAIKQPQQCDPCDPKNPTDAVKQPMQDEPLERTPSEAVRQPLDIECCGPTMRFNLKEETSAEIAIYTVNGRLVRRFSAMLWSGETDVTWDGKDDRGARAASGVYFARVQANQEMAKGKLVLVR